MTMSRKPPLLGCLIIGILRFQLSAVLKHFYRWLAFSGHAMINGLRNGIMRFAPTPEL